MMALYRNGAFGEDAWTLPDPSDPVPGDGSVAVGKARFLAERETLLARNGPLGIVLESGESLDGLEADIARFALVVLRIPRYTDGRNYSNATLLRERHGYAGEIRATGDVLRDQIPFMLRCGIDSFEVVHEPTIRALREGRVRGVGVHYQPAAIAEAAPDGARPWLRVSARH
jgi:uncharacterized protein (DUF934 family)